MIGWASAPASSANLGPGFDCLALALYLSCSVSVETADDWELRTGGEQAGPEEAAFLRAAVTAATGEDRPLRVDVQSDIPRASGLGSSAAVAAAAAAAAMRCMGTVPDRHTLFGIVADLDGHCDNAAATVYGGLVAVVGRRVLHLPFHDELQILVAVPAAGLSTNHARKVLPETVSHAAAARNVARVVAIVEGLRTGDPDALAAAAGDELHESYRAVLAPDSATLVDAARSAGALHVAWSGAGPSVLALVTHRERDDVISAFESAFGDGGFVLRLAPSHAGVSSGN